MKERLKVKVIKDQMGLVATTETHKVFKTCVPKRLCSEVAIGAWLDYNPFVIEHVAVPHGLKWLTVCIHSEMVGVALLCHALPCINDFWRSCFDARHGSCACGMHIMELEVPSKRQKAKSVGSNPQNVHPANTGRSDTLHVEVYGSNSTPDHLECS